MAENFFTNIMLFVNRRIENKFFHSSWWLFYLVFLAVCLSLFFSFPRLDREFINEGHWDVILKQAHGSFLDPAIFNDIPADQHAAKRYYRITLPLIVKVFHLSIISLLILQFLLTTLNYYLFARFIYKLTGNKHITAYLLFASALVFSYRLGFNEMWGHFDILPLLLLTLSVSFRNPLTIFISVFFACWSDERAVLASLITGLYWYQEEKKINTGTVLSVLSAIGIYLLLRFTIKIITGYETPMQGYGVGPECLIYTVPNFIPNLLRSLEGFWIIVLLYLYKLKTTQKNNLFYSTLVLLLITLAGSLMVFDIFRSMAYLIPFVYVCLPAMKEELTEKFSFLILLCCFVYPSNPLLFNDNLMVSGNLAVYEIGRMILKWW